MAFDTIQAQRQLSDKDLQIFQSELARYGKSIIMAYVLLLLFGLIGAHQFYMSRDAKGYLYSGLTVAGLLLIFLFPNSHNSYSLQEPPIASIIAVIFFALNILLNIYDFFTIPTQIEIYRDKVREILLKHLLASKDGDSSMLELSSAAGKA